MNRIYQGIILNKWIGKKEPELIQKLEYKQYEVTKKVKYGEAGIVYLETENKETYEKLKEKFIRIDGGVEEFRDLVINLNSNYPRIFIIIVYKDEHGNAAGIYLIGWQYTKGSENAKKAFLLLGKKTIIRLESNEKDIEYYFLNTMDIEEVLENNKIITEFINIVLSGNEEIGDKKIYGIVDIVEELYKKNRTKLEKKTSSEMFLTTLKIVNRFIIFYLLTEAKILRYKSFEKSNWTTKPLKTSSSRLADVTLDRFLDGTIRKNKLKKFLDAFNTNQNEPKEISFSKNPDSEELINESLLLVPYIDSDLFRETDVGSLEIEDEKGKGNEIIEAFYILLEKDESFKEKIYKNFIYSFLSQLKWSTKEKEESETLFVITPEVLSALYEKVAVAFASMDEYPDYKNIHTKKDFKEKVKKIFTDKKNQIRKEKGIYFTPRHVTEYIAVNTVIPRLIEMSGEDFVKNFRKDGETISNLKDFKEKFEKIENKKEAAKKVYESTKLITILDPAVGSGAFPMAAGDVLYDIRRWMVETLGEEETPFQTAKEIVQDNLYGVDILPGAISVCKMRMWVWILTKTAEMFEGDKEEKVEYREFVNKCKEIELPKIEYNFMAGNSLIGYADYEQIKKIQTSLNSDDWSTIESKTKQIQRLVIEYEQGKRPRREVDEKRAEINEQLDQNLAQESALSKEELKKIKTFHWIVEFNRVMKNGGFDIVIGNPPYFSGITLSRDEQNILERIFGDLWAARNDISYSFVLRGLKTVKAKGYLSFIFPRYYIKSHYARNFRNYLKHNTRIMRIIDTENFQVFGDVNILTTIIVLNKSLEKDNDIEFIRVKTWERSGEELFKLIRSKSVSESLEIIRLAQSELSEDIWEFLSGLNKKIIEKIRKDSVLLADEFCDIGKGMSTGYNDAFEVTDEMIKNEHLEPKGLKRLLKNGDIRQYYIIRNNEPGHVIYLQGINNIDQFPNIKKHLLKFTKELGERKNYNGPWYKYTTPRNIEIFESGVDKIVVPFMAQENRFAIDTEMSIPTSGDVHAILLKKKYQPSIYFFLAVLNSSLIMAYHKNTTQLKREDYIEFNKKQLEKLPIKFPSKEKQELFIKLVRDILSITKTADYLENKHKQEMVDSIKKEIDKLVYDLYNLKNGEIEIIEKFVKKT